MRPFDGRRILLGVTGGIAAYKAGWLARLLTHAGAEVDVVLTRGATEFVGAVTFEGLTGRAVHTDIFERGHALDHIRLARAAHAVVVAPATADFMARAAHGHGDDLLAACLLATEAPVLMVPAMNDRMWAHPQTRANAERLREIGYELLEPDTGPLAAGEGSGPGRMPEPETIFSRAGRLLEKRDLEGHGIVITAGPTREPIDPVRFISNRSSGKMGVALAEAAWRRGANVTLVAGPLEVETPRWVKTVRVESTDEMADAVARALPEADALIMAAAPADFRPGEVASQKIKKASSPGSIQLTQTRDILASTRDRRHAGAVIVGFALETENLIANARRKLDAKELDIIVANSAVEEGSAFGADTNRVTLLSSDGATEELSLRPKSEVADTILDRVEALLRGR
jgi:phosphopantothenoylcysteine decarboxylase/phosphopantothenate--cysteine ligase